MSEKEQLKTWAIVEVMGHVEYAGYVTAESVAGAAMLRIDVPEVKERAAFTKYLATGALYGITPCTEETARARAAVIRAVPFQTYDIESQLTKNLRERGMLIENKSAPADNPFDDDF
jgi:hypothetical protein